MCKVYPIVKIGFATRLPYPCLVLSPVGTAKNPANSVIRPAKSFKTLGTLRFFPAKSLKMSAEAKKTSAKSLKSHGEDRIYLREAGKINREDGTNPCV